MAKQEKMDRHLRCSFCGKSRDEVRKLIAGHQLTSRDDHVIKRVQTNSCWRCHCTTPG